jgi:alpha-D-ribose 1-methylphosphonate 5-triphosphate synthase subunit PhnH
MAGTRGLGAAAVAEAEKRDHTTFRKLVDCMASPGTVASIRQSAPSGAPGEPAVAVLESLLDDEVTFAAHRIDDTIRERVLRATESILADLHTADCALVDGAGAVEAARWARSRSGAPTGSAIVVVMCRSLTGGPVSLRLSGPGIDDEARLEVDGVPAEFFSEMSRRNANFYHGIDVILVAGDGTVACVPKSSQISLD